MLKPFSETAHRLGMWVSDRVGQMMRQYPERFNKTYGHHQNQHDPHHFADLTGQKRDRSENKYGRCMLGIG